EVRLEPPVRIDAEAPPTGAVHAAGPPAFGETLERVTLPRRAAWAVAGCCAARLVVAVGDRLSTVLGWRGLSSPSLGGVALLAATLGGLAGWRFARVRGEAGDVLPS